jgi:hypothetical protein
MEHLRDTWVKEENGGHQPLLEDPESHSIVNQEVEPCRKPLPISTSSVLLILWNCALIIFGIFGILSIYQEPQYTNHLPEPISCNCGSSIAEAISLGCKYDDLAVAWLPPYCRDDELLAEFNRSGHGPGGSWYYYADDDNKMTSRLLSKTEVSMLAEQPLEKAHFWTTWEWHIMHCSFYWRKEFRMRNRGFTVEARYDKEIHVQHCQNVFLDRTPLNETRRAFAVSLGGDTYHVTKSAI